MLDIWGSTLGILVEPLVLLPSLCCLLVSADTGIVPVVDVVAVAECCRYLDRYRCHFVDFRWLFFGLPIRTAAVAMSNAAPGAKIVIVAVAVVVADAVATWTATDSTLLPFTGCAVGC